MGGDEEFGGVWKYAREFLEGGLEEIRGGRSWPEMMYTVDKISETLEHVVG